MSLDVPPGLERSVLLRGPVVLGSMISEVGGVVSASRVMGVSVTTLTRWVQQAPSMSDCFGDPHRHRSLWVGYPSPLSGMDRVVERIFGIEASYVGVLCSVHGDLVSAMSMLRERGSVTLGDLDVDSRALSRAVSSCGVPGSSSRRWLDGVRYPRQLLSLDRLASALGRPGWIEAIVSEDPSTLTHGVPAGALLCMVADMLEERGIGQHHTASHVLDRQRYSG